MDNVLPWYLRFWKAELAVVAIIAVGAHIAYQNKVISSNAEMLQAANTQLATITANYKTDTTALANSIKSQNAVIESLQKQSTEANLKLAQAAIKSDVVRDTTNKQVNAILSKPVAQGCDNSIKQAIVGVQELQWDKAK